MKREKFISAMIWGGLLFAVATTVLILSMVGRAYGAADLLERGRDSPLDDGLPTVLDHRYPKEE